MIINSTLKIFCFDDDCHIIRLNSTRELLRESFLMKNCLNDLNRYNASMVYSLRDAFDKPHANIEIRKGLLIQISGPENCVSKKIPCTH